ncbi:MAG TPA: S-layer homology domain-containing protein [Clostridia bacterium]|nr:S-layer homology domain-containing protein [Clostridia bacterium]
MKKLCKIILLILLITLLPGCPVFAAENGVNSRLIDGIMNEIEYREVIFVTGEPIWLTGKARVTQSGRGDSVQTRITYNLTDSSGQVKFTRNVGFTSQNTKKLAKRQTVTETSINSYSENITIGKDRYVLKDYQYSRSILTDHKPGLDYFSGNWEGKKIYTLNQNQATITVESWGNTVGYEHAWGGTETQTIDNTVTFSGKKLVVTEEEEKAYDQKWSGTYQLNLSYNLGKTLTYESNEPTQISFEGGFLEKTLEEQTLQVSFNMPKFDRDGLAREARNRDNKSVKLNTTPTYRRLPIPYLRDVKGHWAEGDILRLASLEALPVRGDYLGPRLNMTRGEFAYAMSALCQLILEEEDNTKRPALRFDPYGNSGEKEVSPFSDVPTDHPYYKHIKAAYDKGVISGVSTGKFSPDAPLTRAQAITIMIKTLGFEGLAPMYGNTTDYLDDHKIPYWAKDAIYVGSEIGLIAGQNGYCLPNETMSRAEAAAFLNRFLSYLQNDLRYEYRERLLNFR